MAKKKTGEENEQAQPAQPEIKTTVAAVLGEIVWLLSQSPRHRNNLLISDLEWMVMPAILNGQFRIFKAKDKPVAVAIWAFVSDEVQKRLELGGGKLRTDEWRSGPHAWLLELVAPFGHPDKILQELLQTVLAEYTVKCHQTGPDGQRHTVTYKGGKLQ